MIQQQPFRILQARTLEWVAISLSSSWKWKVNVKSLSCIRLLVTPWIAAYQAPPSMGFPRQEYWSGVPLPSPTKSLVGHSQTRLSGWVGLISVHVHSGFWSIPSPSFQPGLSFVCSHSVVSDWVWFCNPMDSSPPGSYVHEIFQARIINWVSISFPREYSQPRDWNWVSWVSCIDRWILYHCTTWKALGMTEHAYWIQ